MNGAVTIHEMESVAQGLDGPELSLSHDLGNVIEIGGDSNDMLGLGMLANPGRQRSSGSGGGGSSYSVPPPPPPSSSGGIGLAEVDIGGGLDAEPMTLDIGGPGSSSAPIEIQFRKAEDEMPFASGGPGVGAPPAGGLFSNPQTATGPGINLASAVTRMNPEEEKKQKIDVLNKLQRLESKGFPVSKRYTMDNTLDEMKMEYDRLVDAKKLEASIRFQRNTLMSVVSGLQFLNDKFDPFDVRLEGWSESVHENIEDFDDIFEELYDKYKSRGNMPPEARLVMALAGSGFMCHVSNTMLRSKMPTADDILRNNPDLARQFAAAAANQAGPGFGNFMNMAMGGGRGTAAESAAPADQTGPAGAFFGASAERMAAQAAQAQAAARFQQMNQTGGTPMAQVPQSVAAMEAPRATARREMRGPTGVDDILRQFEEARHNESMEGTAVPQSPITQPAVAAAVELQSMASEDIGSAVESTRTGRGRRRRAAVGATLSLDA